MSRFVDEVPAVADLGTVHLVGVGGAGMSVVARLLRSRGVDVQGSDARGGAVLDALEAVLARHQPIEHGPNTGWVGEPWDECRTCLGEWPCATVDAIETALAGGCRECRQIDGHHKLDCGRRS